jgi:hypothetical protein
VVGSIDYLELKFQSFGINRLDLGTQTFVSWNQIAIWLRRLEAVRQELSADPNLSRYTQS